MHSDVYLSLVVKLVVAVRFQPPWIKSGQGHCLPSSWQLCSQNRKGVGYSKPAPHYDFLERRIAETPDLSMLELAGEPAYWGVMIDEAPLSYWYRRNGCSYKKAYFRQRTDRADVAAARCMLATKRQSLMRQEAQSAGLWR